MFTIDTESGFNDVVFVTASTAWAKPWCKVRSTLMNLMCTSRPSRPSAPVILRKNLGLKLIKMEFTDTREAAVR